MNDLLRILAEYCDSVSGAESESDLITMRQALAAANDVVVSTHFAQKTRLNGNIIAAAQHETAADVAMSRLWRICDAAGVGVDDLDRGAGAYPRRYRRYRLHLRYRTMKSTTNYYGTAISNAEIEAIERAIYESLATADRLCALLPVDAERTRLYPHGGTIQARIQTIMAIMGGNVDGTDRW